MATNYPGALDAFNNPTGTDALNNATTPHATQHTDANDAIEAIQAELGVNPSGTSATVAARLDTLAPLASPTFTGTVQLGTSATFSLEGSIDDAFETTITVSNPTQDRTITFPNADGTIALIDQPGIPLSASNIQLATATLATTGSVNLAFDGVAYKLMPALTGDVTFTANGYAAGRSVTVRVINGTTIRNLTFPTNWVFVGTKPTNIAVSKTGILTVTSFGTTDADCVAAWAVQA